MKTRIKLENFSSNGRDFRAKGIHIYIPGQSIGEKAIEAEIPPKSLDEIVSILQRTAPAIKVTVIKKLAIGDTPPTDSMPEEPKPEPEAEEPPPERPQKRSPKKRSGKKARKA